MMLFKQATIIGLGLIGGSLGKDLLKRKLAQRVIGYDVSKKHLKLAKQEKLISKVESSLEEAVKGSSLVVIAVPVRAIPKLLKELKIIASENTLIIDVGSTKKTIMQSALKSFPQGNFVGCHPMAGSESSGPQAARLGLFEKAPCLIVPAKNSKKKYIDQVKVLWGKLGAKAMIMPEAAVSHLPHVLSFSMMHSVAKKLDLATIRKIAGPSFKSYTRIAGSDAVMWRDIFLENRTSILNTVRSYQKELGKLEGMLTKENESGIQSYLEGSRKLWEKV